MLPGWDETLLMTHAVQVEMDGLRSNDSDEGNTVVEERAFYYLVKGC